jgi:hypothetical protein
MGPGEALYSLRTAGTKQFFYHHMPLLTLFGNLGPAALLQHNETAMQDAAEVARANVAHCVVGNTEDSVATADLLE